MQVFYTELACPGEGYNPPSIAAAGASDSDTDSEGVPSCQLLDGGVPPTTRARTPSLRLDSLLSHRPISDIQVQSEKYPSMHPMSR